MAKAPKDVAESFDLDDHDAMETLVEKAIESIDGLDAPPAQAVESNAFDELEDLEEVEEELVKLPSPFAPPR